MDSEISDSFEGDFDDSDSDDDERQDAIKQLEAAVSDPFVAQENFKFLDELLGERQHGGDEEDEDPDIKNDPVHQVDLKSFIEEFILKMARENSEYFAFLVSHLPPMEKKHLEKHFKF